MTVRVVIPARFASERFPGKVLALLDGKPLVQHVYEKAMSMAEIESVCVATESDTVYEAVRAFGGHVLKTSETHQSGSERIAEVIEKENYRNDDMVVNLQADEPLLPAALVRQVISLLKENAQADMATLAEPIETIEDFLNPNVVKVVFNETGEAMYFSRAPIPFGREAPHFQEAYRHIGLYAQRVALIRAYHAWQPAPCEQIEKLEQLRVLAAGKRIQVALACEPSGKGIDTPEDLEALL